MIEKVTEDGKVAVIIHAEYGGGWSSCIRWSHTQSLLYNPTIVAILTSGAANAESQIKAYMETNFPEVIAYSYRNLSVVWIPVGTKFRVLEYDGWESIELFDDVEWLTA
jgi:hypothetical protein